MISNFKFQISNLNKNKGFTTIELLVVVAIISVVLGIAISNFSQIRLQFSLSRVVYQFDQDLRKAQNLAMAASQYQDAEIVAGYGVKLDIIGFGKKKYIIYADRITNPTVCNTNKTNCSDADSCIGNEQNDSSDYSIETIDFSQNEPGIIIKEIKIGGAAVNSASINFNSCSLSIIRANITSPDALPANEIDIVFSFEGDLTQTRTVSVNRAGLIKVK